MSKKTENSLYKALKEMDERNSFQRMDFLFIRQMLPFMGDQPVTPEVRKRAYREFQERSGGSVSASVPTMQKWFGIGGYSRPRRSQVYEIAFALHLGREELDTLLTAGLHEPAVQINDYTETVFAYGLENGLDYDECAGMIQEFEQNLGENFTVCHSQNTQELLKEFQSKKGLPKDEFMDWMAERADAFKGYSITARNYLLKFRHTICKSVRKDMQEYLEELLSEAGYDSWRGRRRFRPDECGEGIRKFIYENRGLPEDIRKEILHLVQYIYFEEDTNTLLLSEVYSPSRHMEYHFTNLGKWEKLGRMTEKHLSDLLNVAIQKERDIRTAQAEAVLRRNYDSAKSGRCPEWIVTLIGEYMSGQLKGSVPGNRELSVQEALGLISKYRREHRRRCVLLERSDLLPLVLYIAQHRYLESIGFNMVNYVQVEAKKEFVVLAEQTLAACSMAKISEEYELDALLLTCFQEDDMYSYSEILEMVGFHSTLCSGNGNALGLVND